MVDLYKYNLYRNVIYLKILIKSPNKNTQRTLSTNLIHVALLSNFYLKVEFLQPSLNWLIS